MISSFFSPRKDLSSREMTPMIMEKAGLPCQVLPVSSAEYPTPAKRPLNSRLSGKKLQIAGFEPMPSVGDALDRYLAELKEEKETAL